MRSYTTIHEFSGQSVRVAVRRHHNGRRFRVTIIQPCPENGRGRMRELECGGSREAIELFALLKVAAVMAQYLEEGGDVELWNAN